MNKLKLLGLGVVILLGGFFVVYGGYDDSPGAQLIGLLAVVGGIVGIIRAYRAKKS